MTPPPTAPGSSSPSQGRLAVLSIIVSSAIVALVHASLAIAYLSGRSALEHWSQTGLDKLLFVLPGPGIVVSFFSVTLNSPHSTYVLIGILQFALAGLML